MKNKTLLASTFFKNELSHDVRYFILGALNVKGPKKLYFSCKDLSTRDFFNYHEQIKKTDRLVILESKYEYRFSPASFDKRVLKILTSLKIASGFFL